MEEHFYLLFPTVFLALSLLRLDGRQKAFVFWGTCAVVLVWRCVLVFALHANTERTSLCSDTRVDSIAFGCALAVWNNPVLDGLDDRAESPLWRRVLLPTGIGLLIVTFLLRGPIFRETLRYTLQGIGLTPLFIMAMRHPRWYVFRLLNWRPMRFVGTVSYTLYLVHHVALKAVAAHSRLGAIAGAIVALLISLAIAWAMHVVVEKPCARLRGRL